MSDKIPDDFLRIVSFKDYWINASYLELDVAELVNDIKTHLFDEKIEELP